MFVGLAAPTIPVNKTRRGTLSLLIPDYKVPARPFHKNKQ